jgi:hypothetical protein
MPTNSKAGSAPQGLGPKGRGNIRGGLIPAALGHRQVSLDEYLFPCPLYRQPPEEGLEKVHCPDQGR